MGLDRDMKEEVDGKKQEVDTRPFWRRREDVIAWLLGAAFVVALLAAMFGLGALRGWDADSGWTHNDSATSAARFLPEPFQEEEGVSGRHGTDAVGRWYYWKLPPSQATALSRAAVWVCFLSHLLLMWGCIFYGQKQKLVWDAGVATGRRRPRYSGQLSGFNYAALAINAVFHLLHLGQTHWTYDATAQDVSVASSQSSVIMLIVLVLVLEYRDRGLAFGWPTARHTDRVSAALRLPAGTVNLLRKYHGYAFAWAAIYTFWYHPMESTWGHAMGFLHTFMIVLQGSLIYTELHLNRYWRLVLESWVIIHGSVVASQTGGPDLNGTLLWPMFCFGFLWMFSMTQVYGLRFWRKVPTWLRPTPFVVYLAATVGVYSTLPDRQGRYWIRLNEIIRIPAIEYLAALFSWALIELFLFIERKVQSSARSEPLSAAREAVYVMLVLAVYGAMMTLSTLVQVLDVQVSLIGLMVLLVFVFIVGVGVTSMLLKQCFRRPAGARRASVSPTPSSGKLDKPEATQYGTTDSHKGVDNQAIEKSEL